MVKFAVMKRDKPTVYFLGVTTEKSSSRLLFPQWAAILGMPDTQLIGVNLPINAPPAEYRRAITQIKHDPLSLGAIITTHKINTLHAARDLFDELTPDAALTGEASSIYKRDGRLIAHAADPQLSGMAMGQFIPADHWQQTRASLLCLGAGGVATALAATFTQRADPAARPARIIFVNRDQARLDSLQHLIETRMAGSGIDFAYVYTDDPRANDRLMMNLPPRSLVINATGMGKDIPDSPITNSGQFPQDGFAWELNYRGELDFLHQAQAQVTHRNLTVVDGWHYFLYGWSTILGQILDVEITPSVFDQMAAAAQVLRA